MAENTDTMGKAWYVVATKPRQEVVAQEHLQRQGYAVLLPMLRLRKRQRGKWHEVTEPTFPGYVFVGLELGCDDMAPIRSTQGCRDLVRFGQQPAVVHKDIVKALQMGNSARGASGDEVKDPFSPGDLVAIEDGPFQGLSAIYCMNKGADRVQVLITLLGRSQYLNLHVDSVSK